MKFVGSLITVMDVGRSRKLYEGILGQKVTSDYGEDVVFEGFAIHQRDHYRSLIGDREIAGRSNAFELYFEEDDPDSVEKTIIDEGFEIVHRVREQPWRQKVLRFYDSDGNIIEIGESFGHLVARLAGEGLPLNRISEITYLSVEKIREILDKK